MYKSNIDTLLKDRGLNTIQLAQLCGVSRQALFKARKDAGISECRLSTLGKVARALGVPTASLYQEVFEEGRGPQSR